MILKQTIDLKLFVLICVALLFLSANSILARMAIVTQNIDAFTFTFLRIISGSILLFIIYFYRKKRVDISLKKNWISGFMLFLYAICFSYSYINMLAGIGTLILFAVVQLSMIFNGLVYLLYPKEDFTISYFHTFLMVISGTAWGVYSVLGKSSTSAIFNTTDNFFKASIFTLIFMLMFISEVHLDLYTFCLAITSGAITSALGYLLWYEILPKIEIITASVLQLLVPIIAIFLSILFLDESLTLELIVSTILILVGIFIALKRKRV